MTGIDFDRVLEAVGRARVVVVGDFCPDRRMIVNPDDEEGGGRLPGPGLVAAREDP